MIKELIKDIIYDKITLSQALTRSKLVSRSVKNEILQNWLNRELNGYKSDDEHFPSYRKIWSETHLTVEYPNGRKHTFPIVMENADKDIEEIINSYKVFDPIAIIEQNIKEIKDGRCYNQLTGTMLHLLEKLYASELKNDGAVIRAGHQIISKSLLSNIIELTKQKLIDTLQDLEEEFPDAYNQYVINEENNRKIQNIVVTNIYGSNNLPNINIGENIKQENIKTNISIENINHLKELGVEDELIDELRIIDEQQPKGNPERKRKIIDWLGKVTASLASRGIYDSIPHVVNFIQNL